MAESSAGFFKLPAELRNTIYGLVFTPAHDSPSLINLFAADPPTKAPLLVCRRFYTEARGIYKAAYREYWSTTQFIAEQNLLPTTEIGPVTEADISRVDASDLERISRLTILWVLDDYTEFSYELAAPNGFWKIVDHQHGASDNGRYGTVYVEHRLGQWLHRWDYTEEVDDLSEGCTWSDRTTMKDAVRFLLLVDGQDQPMYPSTWSSVVNGRVVPWDV